MKHSKILVCGDFNIDFLSTDFRKKTVKRKLKGLLDEYGFRNILKNATRVTFSSETMIDYLVTNIEEAKVISVQDSIDLALSDHHMQSVEINVEKIRAENTFRTCRVVNEVLQKKFNDLLGKETWEELKLETDFNTKFRIFHDKYKNIYDSIFIEKRVNVGKKPKNKWMSKGLKISSKNMRCLNSERKKSSDLQVMQHFLEYKRIYRKLLRQAKRKYHDECIQNADNKSKATWKIVNSELGKTKNKKTEILSLENPVTGEISTLPKEIANILNVYYRDIAQNTNSNRMEKIDQKRSKFG